MKYFLLNYFYLFRKSFYALVGFNFLTYGISIVLGYLYNNKINNLESFFNVVFSFNLYFILLSMHFIAPLLIMIFNIFSSQNYFKWIDQMVRENIVTSFFNLTMIAYLFFVILYLRFHDILFYKKLDFLILLWLSLIIISSVFIALKSKFSSKNKIHKKYKPSILEMDPLIPIREYFKNKRKEYDAIMKEEEANKLKNKDINS